MGRWSPIVAVLVAGVLVGQFAPVTLAADSEDQQLPPGTLLLIGEIIAAEDATNHNFLTGPKTEKFPDVEYLGLVYEIIENEVELLVFPDGLVVGEGDVVRNIDNRTRSFWEGGNEWIEYHAHFHSSVEVGIEATWDGEDPGKVTGTFEMRSEVVEVFVNEVNVGTPSEIGGAAPVLGTFDATWSPSSGEMRGTLTPADPTAHPGILTLEAFPVAVEGGGLMSSGPHGLNLTAIQEVLADCDSWFDGYHAADDEVRSNCYRYSSENARASASPESVARGIVGFALFMAQDAHLESGTTSFPSLEVKGVLQVLESLANLVAKDPDDPQALRALVGFLNFNLLITGCTDEECPA